MGQLQNSLGVDEGGGVGLVSRKWVGRRESRSVWFGIEGSPTGEKNSPVNLKAVPYTRSSALYFK